MANIHTTLSGLFTNVANAIRSKNGSTGTIIADNFPVEIENLRTGFDYNNQNVTTIADYEFKNCTDLRSVDCYNLTSIGTSAFEGCTNLKTVVLYDGVTNVGENAFKGCNCVINYKGDNIPETWHENWNPDGCFVIYGELIETWDISATSNDNVIAELYGSGDSYTLYIYGSGDMKNFAYSGDNISPWRSSYGANIVSVLIDDSVTSIGGYAFSYCSSLTSITIPDGVTSIGAWTFNSCSSLTSITIPDSVTSIGGYAFRDCDSLTSITYTNTIAQWNSITFGKDWNYSSGNYTIHCTDGDIAKT